MRSTWSVAQVGGQSIAQRCDATADPGVRSVQPQGVTELHSNRDEQPDGGGAAVGEVERGDLFGEAWEVGRVEASRKLPDVFEAEVLRDLVNAPGLREMLAVREA